MIAIPPHRWYSSSCSSNRERTSPGPDFVCGEPHCPHHYNTAYGCFNTFKRRIDPDTLHRVSCQRDSLPMYVAARDEEHGMWTWRCPQFGCQASSVEMGAPFKSAKA